jgi:hypothetical protein
VSWGYYINEILQWAALALLLWASNEMADSTNLLLERELEKLRRK